MHSFIHIEKKKSSLHETEESRANPFNLLAHLIRFEKLFRFSIDSRQIHTIHVSIYPHRSIPPRYDVTLRARKEAR